MLDQLVSKSGLASGDTLERATYANLQRVPSGAFALAGLAVALLVVAWLGIYFFVFLTRGPVG